MTSKYEGLVKRGEGGNDADEGGGDGYDVDCGERKVCPSHATCYAGYIVDCDHLGLGSLMRPSASGLECVLDYKHRERDIEFVVRKLSDMTLEHTCNCWGLFRFTSTCNIGTFEKIKTNKGHPLFDCDTIAKSSNGRVTAEEVALLGVTLSDKLSYASGMIGLNPLYAKDAVEFTVTCYVQVMAMDVAWYCVRATWVIMCVVAGVAWKVFMSYPVIFGGILVACAAWKVAGDRRQTKFEKDKVVKDIRVMVEGILQENEDGISSEMLKSDVIKSPAFESSPLPRSEITKCYKKAIKAIKDDARVRAGRRRNDDTGEIEEMMEWVYSPRKRGRGKGKEKEKEKVRIG